jgi:hypothetical protein
MVSLFTLAFAAVGAALLVPGAAAAAPSLRCGGALVSVGDSKLDLLGRCGHPTLRDERMEERARSDVDRTGEGARVRRVLLTVERWTYDRGPRELVHVVTLEGGKVWAIERESFGYTEPERSLPRVQVATCEPAAIGVGDTRLELLATCGEPATADRRQELREASVAVSAGTVLTSAIAVEHEIWTYNFGPHRFTQLVTLRDGTVVKVESGANGYSP